MTEEKDEMQDELSTLQSILDEYRDKIAEYHRIVQLQQQSIATMKAQELDSMRNFQRNELSQANVWMAACMAMLQNPQYEMKLDECVEYSDYILSEFNARFDSKTGNPNPDKFKFQID